MRAHTTKWKLGSAQSFHSNSERFVVMVVTAFTHEWHTKKRKADSSATTLVKSLCWVVSLQIVCLRINIQTHPMVHPRETVCQLGWKPTVAASLFKGNRLHSPFFLTCMRWSDLFSQ
eukprot:5606919-Amphidinium_carterae.1